MAKFVGFGFLLSAVAVQVFWRKSDFDLGFSVSPNLHRGFAINLVAFWGLLLLGGGLLFFSYLRRRA